MNAMRLYLEFEITDPVSVDDLDELADIVRRVVDEKVGESDFMIVDIRDYTIAFELIDD